MTNEQVIQNLKEMLIKQANKDLGIVRRTGAMAITQTKVGNLEVTYGNGQYMIVNFNNTNFAHYVGRKAGAVEFLVNNYEVIYE
jgi:hypothetical protein